MRVAEAVDGFVEHWCTTVAENRAELVRRGIDYRAGRFSEHVGRPEPLIYENKAYLSIADVVDSIVLEMAIMNDDVDHSWGLIAAALQKQVREAPAFMETMSLMDDRRNLWKEGMNKMLNEYNDRCTAVGVEAWTIPLL